MTNTATSVVPGVPAFFVRKSLANRPTLVQIVLVAFGLWCLLTLGADILSLLMGLVMCVASFMAGAVVSSKWPTDAVTAHRVATGAMAAMWLSAASTAYAFLSIVMAAVQMSDLVRISWTLIFVQGLLFAGITALGMMVLGTAAAMIKAKAEATK